MRLIIEYDHGSQDAYTQVIRPIIYESKDKFLEDFELEFNKVMVVDFCSLHPFMVGDNKFCHDEHRIMVFKDHPDLPRYHHYDDINNFTIDLKLPTVYTVDEWFGKIENGLP